MTRIIYSWKTKTQRSKKVDRIYSRVLTLNQFVVGLDLLTAVFSTVNVMVLGKHTSFYNGANMVLLSVAGIHLSLLMVAVGWLRDLAVAGTAAEKEVDLKRRMLKGMAVAKMGSGTPDPSSSAGPTGATERPVP